MWPAPPRSSDRSGLVAAENRGQQVALIGSYGPPEEPGIHVAAIDGMGELEQRGSIGGIRNPSFLRVHPDGRHLYAVSETGLDAEGVVGGVVGLRIERSEGVVDLTLVSRRSTFGDQPCHLSIDGTGRWMFVTNYGSGDVAVLPIDDDGRLGECTTRVQHAGKGVDPGRQASPHPHSSVLSPDDAFLIVADLGIDQLIVYAWDNVDGALTKHGLHRSSPGSGPRTVAFHPAGRFLFLVNELASTVTVFEWDAGTATMQEAQSISTLPVGVDVPNLAADLQFSSSGESVFVANRGHDSVMTFSFDPDRGLAAVGAHGSGGRWPRAMALAPSGDHLLVANERSNRVVSRPLLGREPDGEAESGAVTVVNPSSIAFARTRDASTMTPPDRQCL